MKVKLVDPMPYHPLLCYPGTKTPLQAIGLRADGSPLWPLLGADGEEGEGDGDDGDGDEDAEGDDDGDEDEEEEDDASAKGKKKVKKSGPVSREEFDAVTRRLSAADKRRAEAERKATALQKEKDEAERKNKPEVENLKKDLETVTKDHESLQGKFKRLALVNAFLTASAQEKINWHDPKVAQKAADLEDLEIDEDGNVEGIREAVKALAKKSKYLVNTGKANDEDDEEEKTTRKRGASGSGVGSVKTGKGTKNGNGKLSDEELKRRFPALK